MTYGVYDDPPTDGGTPVVLGLVPLVTALPLAWQRLVRDRLRHPYEKWLEAVLSDPPADWPTVQGFWRRHHYDELVERWATAVGVDRLVVTAAVPDSAGRELTAAEGELLRRINAAFHNRDWPVQRYQEVIRRGVVPALEARPARPDGAELSTPPWAVQRANEIAAADVARIRQLGVRVQGPLTALSKVPVPRGSAAPEDQQLGLDAAVSAVMGAVTAVASSWHR